ncbi:nuclear transport factor 2 family protein [uncultured Dokdonia sp.]|uniref:nuclear transport factor 2 family protein n=1 Tax=uncultured Dokdonia sp. TaxID=575653 RepID=UPI00260B687B|nr:nuclear transport factor 2 family protein [uncultured Dokdonia sp.]
MMSPEEIAQKQLDAYNNRDIDSFVAIHHPNVQLYSFSETVPFAQGQKQIRTIYSEIFENSPQLHSRLIHRIVLGNKVIDHEEITGRKGVDVLEFIAIYEVNDTSILKAHFIRK